MAASISFPAFRWASDHGLLVVLGDDASANSRERVLAALDSLDAARIQALANLHPAYASILVTFDPRRGPPEAFEESVRRAVRAASAAPPPCPRLVEIPVCYEGEFALDLDEVARAHGLGSEEVARLHATPEYVVHFLGFVAGFPYLSGLPEQLATPRLPVPRRRVPAGSVAIGGSQAGIYPFPTPGGWRVLGRTPLTLFRADHEPPALLAPRDRVRFVAIGAAEFRSLAKR